jgi:prevent-host-death family protein
VEGGGERGQGKGKGKREKRAVFWSLLPFALSPPIVALATEHGYHSHIRPMRSTNIADLRNRLTQYLQEVRAGEEIIVRDRQRPIARIVPFSVDDADADEAALIASGVMRKGSGTLPAPFWKARRPRLRVSAAVAALRADRDEA